MSRGLKRAPWTSELYNALRVEFERLRSAGMKFYKYLLWSVALDKIEEATEDYLFHWSVKIDGKCLSATIL